MPEGDRRVVFGFGYVIVLLVAAALWHVPAYNKGQREHREEAASYKTYDDEDISECAARGSDVDRLFCLAEKVVANQEQERGRADLHAQQDMATWAVALLWVSAIGIVVSAAGIILIYATLHETRSMTVATREIGQNQSMAYVNVSAVVIKDVKYNNKRLHLEAVLSVVNTGATPAKRVKVRAFCSIIKEAGGLLEGSEMVVQESSLLPQNIVSIQSSGKGVTVREVLPRIVENIIVAENKNALASLYLVIRGSIEYSTVFKKRYLTEFSFNGYVPFEGMPSMQQSSDPVATYKEIGEDPED